MKWRIEKKPVSWFKFDNIRKKFEHESLVALGKSLRRRQYHPVIARSDGTVADGERRVRAAILEGLDALDAIVTDEPLSQTELRLAQGATAFHRADLTADEKYQLCYELLQINTDWREKDVAEHLGIDPATVTKILSASKTIPAVREALKAGQLSMSDVYAISRVPEADQPAMLEAKLHGATRDDLERRVRASKQPPAAKPSGSSRPKRLKAETASGVTITLSGESLDVASIVKALVEILQMARQAEKQGASVRTFESKLNDRSKGKGENKDQDAA